MSSTQQRREVLVIGSGFGGSVAALRLAEAGYEVTVVERGKRWTGASPFATYEAPDGRAAWFQAKTIDPLHPATPISRHAGLLDQHRSQGIAALSAAGVGGGSLAFTGALVQPENERLQCLFPWLDADHMQECYARVRQVIQPAPVPLDLLLDDPHFEQARHVMQWIQRAGYVPTTADMALDWDIVRQELNGEIPAAYTAGQNWYGLNSGAKKSLDKNYLAQAEASGRVELRPLHVVQAISSTDGTDFEVSGIEIDEDGTTLRPFTLTSGLLFLAAGSIGTSTLLVRARATRTLPALISNQAIGQGWGNNGDVVGIHQGPRQHATVAQVAAGVGFTHQQRDGLVHVMGDAINEPNSDLLVSLAMVLPALGPVQSGTFVYEAERDQMQLQWPAASSQRLIESASLTYDLLDCGAQTGTTLSVQANMTAHPLGGAVLGAACHWQAGHVHEYEHLYVIDGALLPGWMGVPPALTIAALAEYLLDHFLLTHKR